MWAFILQEVQKPIFLNIQNAIKPDENCIKDKFIDPSMEKQVLLTMNNL